VLAGNQTVCKGLLVSGKRIPRQPKTKMKTTTTIRLRNKLTGLYYVEGKHFSGTESEATMIERNSPSHLVIRYTYTAPGMDDNMEEVEASLLRRVTKRKDGIEKIEKLSFGDTGRNIHGEAARGHWVVKGYKKDGVFKRTLKDLKESLNKAKAERQIQCLEADARECRFYEKWDQANRLRNKALSLRDKYQIA
jgi:hypothetical protein